MVATILPRSAPTPTNLSKWNSKQNDSASGVNAATVVLKIRSYLRQSATLGFVSFLQTLKEGAAQGGGVSKTQLKKAFATHGLVVSDVDIRALALFLGEDVGVTIPVNPLRDLLFGKLEGRRLELATRAFTAMDSRQQGYLAVDDILRSHDAQQHPDIMFGNQSVIQVHAAFVKAFTTLVASAQLVNLSQWLEFCQCVSAATDKDDYFELVFARVWHVDAGSTTLGAYASNQSPYQPHPPSASTLLDDLNTKNLLATALDFNSFGMSSSSLAPSPPPSTLVMMPHSAPDGDNATVTTRKTSRNATLNSVQAAACMVHMYTDKNSVLPKSKDISVGTQMILSRLRASLKARGASGMVGLSRKFRIMDDDGNGSLSMAEFKKAMRECDVECSDGDLRLLFESFDTDESQSIDFKEFLNGVREPMNERRLALVNAAFKKIDRNGDGVLEPSDIVGCYDASKHPDVIAGKRTEDAIFREFLDTFDVDVKDGKVTLDEWEHYYHNISCVIDNDDYFELMMRNAWQLSGGQGWAASSFEHNQTRGTALTDLLTTAPPVVFATPKRYGNASAGATSCLQVEPSPKAVAHAMPADMQHPKELRRIVKRLKTSLKARGAKGFTGLSRCFRVMDKNGSGTLDLNEFRTAMDRLSLHIGANDLLALFDYFDTDGNGSVSVAEFLKGVRDPMNERRLLFVHMAFDLLDTDKNHVLTIDDIHTKYDARKHPDVIAGRKTEREIYAEFLDTFESAARVHDGQVTLVEWTEYYANISASIDDDDYFELMMRNAWHISGGEGWCANSTNRRVLVNDNQVVEIQNDLGVKRYEEIQARLGKQGFGTAANAAKVSFFDVLDHTTRPVEPSTRPRLRNNSSEGAAFCLTMPSAPSAKASTNPRKATTTMTTSTSFKSKSGPTNGFSKDATPIATVGVQPILERLRSQLKAMQHGYIGLSRAFKHMDLDGNGHLSMAEFKEAVAPFGIADVDARILFNYFDMDHSGTLEISEFITGLRGQMNARRLGFVHQSFALMDKDGNGVLEPSDIVEAYDASKHPDVIAGRKTPDQVFREFLDTFDVDGHHDAKVTPAMWEHYYANISASIDDDDYFELMMRNAWHISGGVGWCANSTNRRVLVNDTQVVELENDLGLKSQDIPVRLAKQLQSSYMNQPGTIKTLNSVNVTACLNHTIADAAKSAPPMRLATKIVPLQAMHSADAVAPRRNSGTSTSSLDGVWGGLRQLLRSKGLAAIVQTRRALLQHGKSIAATQVQAVLQTTIQTSVPIDVVQALVDDVRTRVPLRGEDVTSPRASTSALWASIALVKDSQLVKMAKRIFAYLQVEAKGECTPLVLAKAYDAPRHPTVVLGLAQADDVFKDFARCFDVDATGLITYESMDAYCSDLYLSLGELPHTLQMLRDCFHVEIPS
ncbi:Aste57867_17964 [Aphanomyces stellatus]|uniref:Aste57867_17964 protein n=1 Tax=Aphanomyces stellatus TaxID=120398 RepID=A0A485L9H9_9STRA|nr:hypothetical protein As57867_017902 [Aphanomyces stellatus]VFT94704.1 Aste57867_17964 [Aphanomyces stellatus]